MARVLDGGFGFALIRIARPSDLINIERSGLSDQIAQFSITISARVEVGGNVRKALPHRTQADPAIFCLHLHYGLVQDGNGRARRVQGFGGRPLFGSRNLGLG